MNKLQTCVAPTNEPNTCITCGATLKAWGNRLIEFSAATPEQQANFPITNYYDADGTVYLGSMRGPFGVCLVGKHRGLSMPTPRSEIGDGLFCTTRCAVAFARIAANAGLRLPTMPKKERRELRRYFKFVRKFAPATFLADDVPPPTLEEMRRAPIKKRKPGDHRAWKQGGSGFYAEAALHPDRVMLPGPYKA